MGAGQGDSHNVIAGPQPGPAQAGGRNVDVVTASPVPGGADECLTAAGVDDSGHRERSAATVTGGVRRGGLLAGANWRELGNPFGGFGHSRGPRVGAPPDRTRMQRAFLPLAAPP